MIGGNLKKLRGKRTQEEVAKLLGISRARYSHYENGARQPDFNTLEQLANFYNVSTDYLLGRDSKVHEEANLISESKEERDIAKRMAELRADLTSATGLLFDGEPMSDEAIDSLLEAMEFGVRTAKRINNKYKPKKHKVDEEE